MTTLILSIALAIALFIICFQYLVISKLRALGLALHKAASAGDELLVFLAQASGSEHPGVEILSRGPELQEMMNTRLNNLAFALQDASGSPRRPIAQESQS
jgi:hypothetical protein